MLCHHCRTEIDEGFQFCPKCGLRLRTVNQFFGRLKGRHSLYRSLALALALLAAGLIALAVRHNRMSRLKPGRRDGLTYVAWLAHERPSVSSLQRAIGKPIRSAQVSEGRTITWFRIGDGLAGVESGGEIFHFRPDKPAWREQVPASYRRQSEPVSIADEWVTNYDGPGDLGLTSLASERRPSAVTEFIVWKRTAY
jgi:zinc-ribbon domain